MAKRGQFKPGQSGNPKGKPKGARHKATPAAHAPLDGEAEGLARKAVDLALEGDTKERLMSERNTETGRFLTGNSGGGRPKGSRNKLGEQFLSALAEDFAEHGHEAIVACREAKPTEYLKVVAGLLPRELQVLKDPVNEMSDEEIADVLDILRGIVAGDGERPHRPTHKGSGTA